MKKLRIGVIGLGWGRAHIAGYQSHPAAEVIAIADPDRKRLAKIGDECNIAGRYVSAEAMLQKEKLDVVSVATPNKYHCSLTMAAFKAGCHVLCEKPLAMNTAEGRKMLAAAKKHKKRLMINFGFRFKEQSWAIKKQVESGVLGDIYFARTVWHRRRGIPGSGWFGQKKLSGGGPLIDLGVHRLDLALWLMNYPEPEWVMGSAYNKIAAPLAKKEEKAFDVEDFAAGFIKFKNGATLEIEASWAANIRENNLMETRLYGNQGGLLQHNIGEGYDFEAEIYVEREGCQFDMKLHPPVPDAINSAMYHFVHCILNNKPHIATGEEGLIVMELLDAIYLSSKQCRPVRIKRNGRVDLCRMA